MFHAEIEHTSISMTSRLVLFFVISLLAAKSAPGQRDSSTGTVTPEQRVFRLGTQGNNDAADIEQLARNPVASAKLLIAGLHPIPDSKEFAKADDPSIEHVLWLLRGLRYVTGGLDFCAESKHVFGSSEEETNRKYWLTCHHKKCLTFFGYWMSRDRTYIAPRDAQKKIIAQWQHWYATSGSTFDYRPLQNPPPEKWIW